MTTSKHVFKALILLWGLMNVEPVLAKSDDAITQPHKQFIAQAFQQWADGGRTFFHDVLSADVVWTIKGTGPAARTYRGRNAFLQQAVAPFAARRSSFVTPTVNNIWAEGNDVIVCWDGAGLAKDGKPYNNSFVWILKMEQMRAVEVIAFLDLSQYEDVINRIQLTATPGT